MISLMLDYTYGCARRVCICTALCQQHFSLRTHNFPHCSLNDSLSTALQSVGLNDRAEHSVQGTAHTAVNTALLMCTPAYGEAVFSRRLPLYLVLQWVEWHLHSLASIHNSKEWIPQWICSGGRLYRLSPHLLPPSTLALMGELVRGKK